MQPTLKVALTGAHSTGKTSLLEAFAPAVDFEVVTTPEVPRKVIAWAGAGDDFLQRGNNTLLRQGLIIAGQIEAESMAMMDSPRVLLSDRTVVDHWAYTVALLEPEQADDVDVALWRRLVDRWITTYDLIVRLPPEIPLTADGVREEDEAFRTQIDATITSHLDEAGVSYVTVGGTVEERVAELKRLIEECLS